MLSNQVRIFESLVLVIWLFDDVDFAPKPYSALRVVTKVIHIMFGDPLGSFQILSIGLLGSQFQIPSKGLLSLIEDKPGLNLIFFEFL